MQVINAIVKNKAMKYQRGKERNGEGLQFYKGW